MCSIVKYYKMKEKNGCIHNVCIRRDHSRHQIFICLLKDKNTILIFHNFNECL